MVNMNAQAELDKLIDSLRESGKKPKLLLHCCCAPCASYCLEYLNEYFDITALFFNPNIMPKEEYDLRLGAFDKLLTNFPNVKKLVVGGFENEFLKRVSGLEQVKEGGVRCEKCIRFRLEKTAELSDRYDYYATTLTVSPHKNAAYINETGLSLDSSARYLPTDFKKKNGFLRSTELSKQFELYRQNYCGCKFD